MGTSEYKVVFDSKKKKSKEIKHKLTLDEYDDLTLDNQILGASLERGKIIAELARQYSWLMELAEGMESTKDKNIYSRYAYGLKMATNIIENLPPYEENVGCRECGVI